MIKLRTFDHDIDGTMIRFGNTARAYDELQFPTEAATFFSHLSHLFQFTKDLQRCCLKIENRSSKEVPPRQLRLILQGTKVKESRFPGTRN